MSLIHSQVSDLPVVIFKDRGIRSPGFQWQSMAPWRWVSGESNRLCPGVSARGWHLTWKWGPPSHTPPRGDPSPPLLAPRSHSLHWRWKPKKQGEFSNHSWPLELPLPVVRKQQPLRWALVLGRPTPWRPAEPPNRVAGEAGRTWASHGAFSAGKIPQRSQETCGIH